MHCYHFNFWLIVLLISIGGLNDYSTDKTNRLTNQFIKAKKNPPNNLDNHNRIKEFIKSDIEIEISRNIEGSGNTTVEVKYKYNNNTEHNKN